MENMCILNDQELNEVNGGKISAQCVLTTAGSAIMGAAGVAGKTFYLGPYAIPGAVVGGVAGGAFAAYTSC